MQDNNSLIVMRAEVIVREHLVATLQQELDTLKHFPQEPALALVRGKIEHQLENCERLLFALLEQLGAL